MRLLVQCAVSITLTLVTSAGDVPLLIRPVGLELKEPLLQEPKVQDYYGFLRNYTPVPLQKFSKDEAPQVLRVRNMDDLHFQQYIRDGQPVVVEDCTRGFEEINGVPSIDKLTCKDFANKWPTGNMRAEYTPGQYHIYLRDPEWYSKLMPTKQHDEHMAHKNKIAGPYVWHVKDEEPLKTKRSVQRHWRTPYFLEPSLSNRMEANESFEFWFAMAGGGTFTHADAYCESTISMQFQGYKRWRIQAFPEIRHYLNATGFHDEQIYGGKTVAEWMPETEFTVGPGECFIFPTGYLHETYVDPEENDKECYTAATFQFNHPRQVNLYRAFMSRFSMSHYGTTEPCVDKMRSYATLLSKVNTNAMPSEDSSAKHAAQVLQKYDTDGDGVLSASDFKTFFRKNSKDFQRLVADGDFRYAWDRLLNKRQREEFNDEVITVWSEDAIQYHDLNRDAVVTAAELAKNFLHWHVVKYRNNFVRELKDKKMTKEKKAMKLIESEVRMLRKFYCPSDQPCEVAEELEKFGAQLKASKKLSFKLMQLFDLLADDEGEEEVLTMKDRQTGEMKRETVKRVKEEM